MWKKAKALVEPLERLATSWGTKGPKSNTTHSGGNSQITSFTKQPKVSEIQKQITVNNFSTSNKALEQTVLRNFLFENFSIFKVFSPQPAPIPVVFSKTPLRVCKPQGFGVISQHAFLRPAGIRNLIGHAGIKNFSTIQPTMINNCTGSGGAILAQLSLRPFSSAFAKSGSLWFQREESLDNNKISCGIKKQKVKVEKKKETIGRKLFVQNNNKGIFEIVKNSDIVDDKNNPRVVRRSSIKKSLEENQVVENVPELLINDREDVQVYMSIILSSSIFWNLDDSTSMSNSTSSVNSNTSVLSYLLQRRNEPVSQRHNNSQLNSSFVQHLQEIAEMQHDHMTEVISILGALLRDGDFEIKISGCELRVNFPRGMQKIEIENMLQNLGIDPNSPHFELEEIFFDNNIEFSPLTDEDNEGLYDMQLPEPNSTYFDNGSPDFEFLSYSSSSDSSPVLLPSRGSMDCTSGFSSPCNTPPRLGAEYIYGIQEFLNAVDEALVRNTDMFGNRNDEIRDDYIRNTNMYNNRDDYDIGEDYYEN